jgi:hypothetical protein
MNQNAHPVVAVSLLLCAAVAGAQAPPPQPTGMLSPSNPVLFTMDGLPDGNGDLPAMIEYQAFTGGPGVVQVNFGNVVCNGSPIHRAQAEAMPAGGPINEFAAGSGMVMLSSLDNSDPMYPRPIGASYTEGPGSPSQGSAAMVDSDGDHRYEGLMVGGTKGGSPVAAELDLHFYDGDRDGFPEFVTLFDPAPADPMYNLGVLQFFGLDCVGSTMPYTQAWIPVARDLDGDPAVIGDLDGNGIADPEFLWGPKLRFGGGLLQVPTLSGLGLAALATLLLVVGWALMRRRALTAGV